MINAIIVPADPDEPLRQEQVETVDVDTYRHIVGGNLELVTLANPTMTMYINEDGKGLDLRHNGRATVLVWIHNSAFRGIDIIMGDAMIVGPPDAECNDTSVPEEIVKLLFETSAFKVRVQTVGDDNFYGNQMVYDNWLEAYSQGIALAQRWLLVEEIKVVPAE